MKRMTPLFIYDDLTEAMAFWKDRFGFEVTVEVPTDPSKEPAGQLVGFVILQRGDAQLMLQSRQSVELDAPGTLSAGLGKEGVALYGEVEELSPIIAAAAGCEVILEERESFYGMREFGVRAPGGISVTFAQRIGGGV